MLLFSIFISPNPSAHSWILKLCKCIDATSFESLFVDASIGYLGSLKMQVKDDVVRNLKQELETFDSFLGGPPKFFNQAGDATLRLLKYFRFTPSSKTLDIGCGCLRIGVKLIDYLEAGNYFGIEPNSQMLDAGVKYLLADDKLRAKAPSFSNNTSFSLLDFNCKKFDVIIARSIWTHSSKGQISEMLNLFAEFTSADARFFASVAKKNPRAEDYQGDGWAGKSHESNVTKVVHHDPKWIKNECAKHNLNVYKIGEKKINFGGQIWLMMSHR